MLCVTLRRARLIIMKTPKLTILLHAGTSLQTTVVHIQREILDMPGFSHR